MGDSTGRRRNLHLGFWLIVGGLTALILIVFRDILLPFVAGIVIAYFLNPLADALERRGVSRTAAGMLVIAALAIVIVSALVLLVPLLIEQTKSLAATLPGDIERLRTSIETSARTHLGGHFPALQQAIERLLTDLQASLAGSLGQMLPAMLSRSLALMNLISLLFITPLVAFYLLVDWNRMLDTVGQWLPRDHAATIRTLATDIDRSVAAFVRGQGTICLILGAFYATGLSIVGLRYGLFVGLATGLLAFVPVVGWALGLIVALALALAQFGIAPTPLALVGLVMVLGMVIDTVALSPRLVGEQVGLHPVWLIFALFAFSYLFGFVGTLVAVPLAAAAIVLVRHALALYMQSEVYLGSRDKEVP